ncbi:putative U4/U6.U5 tri-snRNP-associated protein 1 [Monocercomonoides exilis]|uniref:putative U4/U6.U5 tri-snRNP-associated protein 1 n=1 Tax=Monocercomonoides exilis TaxID=2049356 RepID=UPI00355AB90C|nr:putative U4/U6.U5 tri-snRNP-associated protein 1 [Monocercomonoides exilis]|eukprot:MONOS_4996.1-p1 / transcript=MONOS_4996.1 / gene=MONOS_4996 / organism=Monocercomonoides_exilis_PA203 / gene_product=unspecified product / transcript_product=unspecified product / location=Mono_scaffold00140:75243-77826(-) / protein_length=810 / sequence_SO=supercontig / SO=protein_coding / is_pseudo=false
MSETSDASGGDVSLSIEETNKLRISLGLKPLNVNEDSLKRREEEKRRIKEEQEKEQEIIREEEEAERKLQEKTHKSNQKLVEKGSKIAEEYAHDEESISSWASTFIERSKALEIEEKKKQEMEAKKRIKSKKEEALQQAAVLHGTKVLHSLQSFEEGKDVILTLKDTSVLGDEEDAWESTLLVEEEKTKHRLKMEKKIASRKMRNPFDDIEEDELFPEMNGDDRLLTRYDDDEVFKRQKEKNSFRLNLLGNNSSSSAFSSQSTKSTSKSQSSDFSSEQTPSFLGIEQANDVDGGVRVQRDFYTTAEMDEMSMGSGKSSTFKKKKKKKKNTSAVKSFSISDLIDDGNETEAQMQQPASLDSEANGASKLQATDLNSKAEDYLSIAGTDEADIRERMLRGSIALKTEPSLLKADESELFSAVRPNFETDQKTNKKEEKKSKDKKKDVFESSVAFSYEPDVPSESDSLSAKKEEGDLKVLKDDIYSFNILSSYSNERLSQSSADPSASSISTEEDNQPLIVFSDAHEMTRLIRTAADKDEASLPSVILSAKEEDDESVMSSLLGSGVNAKKAKLRKRTWDETEMARNEEEGNEEEIREKKRRLTEEGDREDQMDSDAENDENSTNEENKAEKNKTESEKDKGVQGIINLPVFTMSAATAIQQLSARGLLSTAVVNSTNPFLVGSGDNLVTPVSAGIPSTFDLTKATPEDFADIDITHRDAKGRVLDQKEAWKQHAREFHNQQPKPKKAAKHERKLEGRAMVIKALGTDGAMISSDSFLAKKQKETGSAGVEYDPTEIYMENRRMKKKERDRKR